MKIIQLTAENVKKLTAVQISPDGNMVQITGKNGQGKTSVLDSIWWALAGTENIQKQPIRAGADKAKIVLKLGTSKDVELIVERRFSEKASYLEVKTADGAKYPSPQKMLDDLLGSLTFDPLDFMRRDGKGQFEVLKGLVRLEVDLVALDLANKADFEKRTGINRDAKARRAQAQGIAVPDTLPEKPIDEGAMLDAIQQAADANAETERRRSNREAAKVKISHLRTEADQLETTIESDAKQIQESTKRECDLLQLQIDDLLKRKATAEQSATQRIRALREERAVACINARAEADEIEKKLTEAGDLPAPVDIGELRIQLNEAKTTNAHIAERQRRQTILAEAEDLETQSKALTKAMEDRVAQKDAAIAAAKMPIEGLSFGDGAVTFNGLPLDQASDAEQLMVSTAIAAALNPKLRVIRIRDGSLLDDDAVQQLGKFADAHDMQIWIERVDGSGTVGIVMEDGHVRGQAPKMEAAE